MDLAWNGKSCAPFEVLRASVAKDSRLVESYVRGADLVANYSQSPTRAVAPHFYWRATYDAKAEAAGIESVISIQTDLLDSQPLSMVESFAIGVRLFHAPKLEPEAFTERTTKRWGNYPLFAADSVTNLIVLRHEQLGISYAELVHPSDFDLSQLEFRLDGRSGLKSMLFSKPHLEKGVIRRARICGWFLPAKNDLAVAAELAKQFVEEPLPLTT